MIFDVSEARQKIANIKAACEQALQFRTGDLIPKIPARDALVLKADEHPRKKGLSYREGQARLLHDLGSIELQAMELGYRSLVEFPQAPAGFREELAAITLDEAKHFELCLDAIEKLGHRWGEWPVHTALWESVDSEDSLLDRILTVHRYLEGSGLDAGDTLLRRLDGILESCVHPVVKTIVDDEVGHVEFGSRWYREICRNEGRNPQDDFPERMASLKERLPKRMEKLSYPLRREAGFTDLELQVLEARRNEAVERLAGLQKNEMNKMIERRDEV
jgi:uncharacterized ferritin-like protein (DUF455 family)